MTLLFPTRAERPGRQPHAAGLRARLLPEFMYHDDVQARLFARVIAEYAEFHFYVWDDEREEVVGAGHALPAAWDGNGASLPDGGNDALVHARCAKGAPASSVHCALQAAMDPEYR